MIQASDISIETVARLLDDAAIDNSLDDEGDLYVTGLQFNFWIRFNQETKLLQFHTFWDLLPDVTEAEALSCMSALNGTYVMLQFSLSPDASRLHAAYMFPTHDGLNPRFLFRTARMFAAIFYQAVHDNVAEPLLLPTTSSGDESELVSNKLTLLN